MKAFKKACTINVRKIFKYEVDARSVVKETLCEMVNEILLCVIRNSFDSQ